MGRADNKGYSYTLITPEQDMYIGEIIEVLELREYLVKQELRDLLNKYELRMKSEGKKVKSVGVVLRSML